MSRPRGHAADIVGERWDIHAIPSLVGVPNHGSIIGPKFDGAGPHFNGEIAAIKARTLTNGAKVAGAAPRHCLEFIARGEAPV